MTEKRFISEDDCCGYYTEIIDNEKELDLSLYNPKKNLTIEELVDLLNKLSEENEQLKQILGFLKNDNAKDIVEVLNLQQTEIWKLKRGVYNVIDNKIEEVKSHIITTPKITSSDNTSNMIFVAMIDLLLDLKKELME